MPALRKLDSTDRTYLKVQRDWAVFALHRGYHGEIQFSGDGSGQGFNARFEMVRISASEGRTVYWSHQDHIPLGQVSSGMTRALQEAKTAYEFSAGSSLRRE